MIISLYTIDKKGKDALYRPMIDHYVKMVKPFAEVRVIDLFDKSIAKAQEVSSHAAQISYTRALEKYLDSGYNIGLDPKGKEVDSYGFADLFKDKSRVNLFIGGAYGFEAAFLQQCNFVVSFGKITLSHKLMKPVVLEQVFRAMSIIHHHPYHK